MRLAIVGAGWAGMAAAVAAMRAGHSTTVFEAARTLGGRARGLEAALPDGGGNITLDNGQHILIGAYRETLALMESVGVDPSGALLALPLALRFADGAGLKLPRLRAPLDALLGIATARGWSWRDRSSLLLASLRWRRVGFECAADATVAGLCEALTPRVRGELIEPLCVSALNTPLEQASGQVFLRVLRDALFGAGHRGYPSSCLLLPRTDLGTLFPDAAAAWLHARGGTMHSGHRIGALSRSAHAWRVEDAPYDAVLLATAPRDAARLVESAQLGAEPGAADWVGRARALRFEAITTVYALADTGVRLAEPMLSLRSGPDAPSQFVFDRARLGGPAGLLAFVVSASTSFERAALEAAVLRQAQEQLGLTRLRIVQTVVEKRATFACTPGLKRPALRIAAGLFACGDYVEGPYPATLEGAVTSALAAVQQLPLQSPDRKHPEQRKEPS